MGMNRKSFDVRDLRLVAPAPPTTIHHPGTLVRLNSDGSVGVVTKVSADDAVSVTWLTMPLQHSVLPTVCVSSAVI